MPPHSVRGGRVGAGQEQGAGGNRLNGRSGRVAFIISIDY